MYGCVDMCTGVQLLQRPEEGAGSSGAGVTWGCESPDLGAERWTQILCKAMCAPNLWVSSPPFTDVLSMVWCFGYFMSFFQGCSPSQSLQLPERHASHHPFLSLSPHIHLLALPGFSLSYHVLPVTWPLVPHLSFEHFSYHRRYLSVCDSGHNTPCIDTSGSTPLPIEKSQLDYRQMFTIIFLLFFFSSCPSSLLSHWAAGFKAFIEFLAKVSVTSPAEWVQL